MSVTLLQVDYVTRKKIHLMHFDNSVCLLFFLKLLFKLPSKGHVKIFDVTHTLLFMTVLFYFLIFVHSGGPLLFFHSIETLISPEVFAEVLCDDLDLPAAAFVPAVVQAIRQQIKQFDSDSEISLDKQTDQRVIIKVGCLEVLDNSLLLKLIIHVFVLGEFMKMA